MPNWNHNTIICKADLRSYIINGNEVDFNILVPEPRTKEECLAEYGEEYILKGNEGIQKLEDREWFNWYDWHVAFWGTKWEAINTSEYKDKDYYFIDFETAWSPPRAWLGKLASLGKPFILCQEEEGGEGSWEGFNGETDIKNFYFRDWDIEDAEDDPNYESGLPSSEVLKEFFGD